MKEKKTWRIIGIIFSLVVISLIGIQMLQERRFEEVAASFKSDTTSILYKKGLEVLEKMDVMAECEEYIELLSSSPEVESLIKEIGEKDYAKPDVVYQIMITDEAINSILSLVSETDLTIPEQILPDLYRRFFSAIPTTLNAVESTTLAVTSLLRTDMDFLCKDLTKKTMYLYLYENAYSAVVLFIPMDEGIVRAEGNFIVNKQFLSSMTEEEIVNILEKTGYFIDCEIQKVEVQE